MDNETVNWPIVRRVLKEFISVDVIYRALPVCRLCEAYRVRSEDALAEFCDMLDPGACTCAVGILRIGRTI